MSQTRTGSLAEAGANIAIGFSLNFGANIVLLPWLFDPARPARSAFLIGLWFTAISLVRSYVLRRWFNGLKFGNKAEPAKKCTLNPCNTPPYHCAKCLPGMEHAP